MANDAVLFEDLSASARVSFSGDIDFAVVADISASHIEEWTGCGPLTVEMGECSFLDSSALTLLVRLQRASAEPVVLANPTPRIARLLDMVCLTGLFQIQHLTESR